MPWHLEERDGKFCVIKTSDGENEGCHETREEAVKQQRALYANEGMTASVELHPIVSPDGTVTVVDQHGTEVAKTTVRALTAATIPAEPPAEWFTLEEAEQPTPLTITADGQVYGHLALWETCHTGFLSSAFSQCIKPPRSESGYQFFNLGSVETDKGMIAAGNLTYGTGHAPLSMGMQAAAAHYDNTGKVGANVRASDGQHGIWLAGAVVPGADLRALRANPPSGDWRPHRHGLELTAALAVPVPGFPVPRSQLALSASGISALILPGFTEDDVVEPRSREFLRRKQSLTAAIRCDG